MKVLIFLKNVLNGLLKKRFFNKDKRGIAISLAQKGICFYEEKFYKKAKDFLEVF